MSYTELHFHLLPGVDDGPSSIEESIALAAAAAQEGTRTIVATPHIHPAWPTDVSSLPARVEEVEDRLRRERVRVRVIRGAELSHEMVGGLSQAELDLIAHGPAGKRWLLLEASLAGLDDGFTAAAEEVRARGFAVVVAHPERSLVNFHAGWRVIESELAAGSAMQVNAWSLAGLYGDRVRINAFRLLHAAPRVAVASDAHGPERMPSLQLALDALAGSGERDPGRLMSSVPQAMLRYGLTARPEALAA